jgi:hypothetical protein
MVTTHPLPKQRRSVGPDPNEVLPLKLESFAAFLVVVEGPLFNWRGSIFYPALDASWTLLRNLHLSLEAAQFVFLFIYT